MRRVSLRTTANNVESPSQDKDGGGGRLKDGEGPVGVGAKRTECGPSPDSSDRCGGTDPGVRVTRERPFLYLGLPGSDGSLLPGGWGSRRCFHGGHSRTHILLGTRSRTETPVVLCRPLFLSSRRSTRTVRSDKPPLSRVRI